MLTTPLRIVQSGPIFLKRAGVTISAGASPSPALCGVAVCVEDEVEDVRGRRDLGINLLSLNDGEWEREDMLLLLLEAEFEDGEPPAAVLGTWR